jgi:urea transport system ATP-binding protein
MSVHEREATGKLLLQIAKNRAVLVIEHDMDFVKQIAHRVTVLHQGKLLAEGTMDEIQKNPKVIEVYLGH